MNILAFFFLFGLLFQGVISLTRYIRKNLYYFGNADFYLSWSDDIGSVNQLARAKDKVSVGQTTSTNYLRISSPWTIEDTVRSPPRATIPIMQILRRDDDVQKPVSHTRGTEIFMTPALEKTA